MRGRGMVFGFVALAVILGLALAACRPAATPAPGAPAPTPTPQVFKWRMVTSWPSGIIVHRHAEHFADLVKQMSNGRLQIEVFPAGAIVPALEVMDAVGKGTVEVGHTWAGYYMGKELALVLFAAVPAGMTDVEYMTWLYRGGGLELWREIAAKYNIIPFPAGVISPEVFAHSNKPIRTLEDFKGLKFRTVGLWAEILKEMGASVVTLPAGEIYPALERKVLDAAEFSIPSIDWDLGFHEITKYLVVPGVHQPASIPEIEVNLDAWNKLPPDLQAIFDAATRAAALDAWTDYANEDMEALRKYREYGTQIIKLSPETLARVKKLAQELLEKKAAENPTFAKVYESFKRFREKWADYEETIRKIPYAE